MEEVTVTITGQTPERTTTRGQVELRDMSKKPATNNESSSDGEVVPVLASSNDNNNNNNNAVVHATVVMQPQETVQSSAPAAEQDDDEASNPFADTNKSLAKIVAKRGSPVTTRKKDVETKELEEIATWNTYVDELFKLICQTLNDSEESFAQYAEHTFLGTVLQVIQNDTYKALKKDPELFAIPQKVFQVIDTFIQENPILLRKDRMTNKEVEKIAVDLDFAAGYGITEDFRFPSRTESKKDSPGCCVQ